MHEPLQQAQGAGPVIRVSCQKTCFYVWLPAAAGIAPQPCPCCIHSTHRLVGWGLWAHRQPQKCLHPHHSSHAGPRRSCAGRASPPCSVMHMRGCRGTQVLQDRGSVQLLCMGHRGHATPLCGANGLFRCSAWDTGSLQLLRTRQPACSCLGLCSGRGCHHALLSKVGCALGDTAVVLDFCLPVFLMPILAQGAAVQRQSIWRITPAELSCCVCRTILTPGDLTSCPITSS